MAQDLSPLLPEKLQTIFLARRCSGLASDGFPNFYKKSVNLSSLTLSDKSISPQPRGVEDTVWTIRDSAVALYNTPAGPPTNQSALDDLATQTGQDLFDFRSVRFDKVYSGINSIPPNALIDITEFCYTSTRQTTRIQSLPYGGEPREYQHQDSAISLCHTEDRFPGILMDIPGASSGNSMTGVVSLEDGRLALTFDASSSLPCTCGGSTPSCGTICVVTQSGCPGNPPLDGVAITLTTKSISAINVTNGGSGYTSTPGVAIATTNGNGGTATALLTATTVNTSSATLGSGGSGYTTIPAVTFTTPAGQTGSGATASLSMAVNGGVVGANGTGYTVGDTLTASGGTSSIAATLTVATVNGGGGVLTFTVGTAGSYTVLPASPVAVTGGTGTAATFDLTYKVLALIVTSGGTGYSAPPTVAITGGGGTGAGGTVKLTATTLASVTVNTPGHYHTAPAITFSGGSGSGAAATATLTSATTVGTCTTTGQVTSVAVTSNGSGYTSAPTVSFSGGGGTGAAATATLTATTFTVTNAGSGYTTTPAVGVSGGGGSGASGRALLATTTVASIAVGLSGSGYTSTPTVTLTTPTGQTGSGATASARMGAVSVSSVIAGGTGYTAGDVLTVSGGTSSAVATIGVNTVDGSGVVLTASVASAGTYSVLPANPVSVTGGTGTGATFNLLWSVVGAVLTNAGTNYSGQPTVGFSGGSGSGATATTALTASTLASITLISGGTGYTSAPAVAITGGGGSLATATVSALKVTAVAVTSGGSGYTSAPAVGFTGGGGTGAAATSTVLHQCCIGITSSGGYTYTGSLATYTTITTNVVLASCAPGATQTITLSPDSTHVCCVACSRLLPKTLFLTDSMGTHTLTWVALQSAWISPVIAVPATVYTGTTPSECSSTTTGGATNIQYSLGCITATNGLRLTEIWYCFNCGFQILPFGSTGYYPQSGHESDPGVSQVTSPISKFPFPCTGPLNITYQNTDDPGFNAGGCGNATLLHAPFQGPWTLTE